MSAEPVGAGDYVEKTAGDPEVPTGTLAVVDALTPIGPNTECEGCGAKGPTTGLLIRGFPPGPGYLGWCACAWRPVSRRSDFERLLESLRASAHDVIPIPHPVTA